VATSPNPPAAWLAMSTTIVRRWMLFRSDSA